MYEVIFFSQNVVLTFFGDCFIKMQFSLGDSNSFLPYLSHDFMTNRRFGASNVKILEIAVHELFREKDPSSEILLITTL